MEQKDLQEQLDRIFSLQDEEYRKRSLYLKQLADGEIQGPPTNYSFIDQSWQKKYEDEAILSEIPRMNMVDFLYENNKDNLDDIALVFENKKITYRELFTNIDKYANSLMMNGYNDGDVIGLAMPSTPEAVYLFYAIVKIGAVANLIDIRKDKEEIKHYLVSTNTKGVFTLDMATKLFTSLATETGVKDVISVSAVESFPKIIQTLYNLKNHIKKEKKPKNYINLDDFLAKYDAKRHFDYPVYTENKPTFIVFTSGTTNMSKPVLLTSDTANARVHQYMKNGMLYDRQQVYLNVIPPFLAFGTIVGMHLPLCMGMKDALIPALEMDKIVEYFKKYHPNHVSITPAAYDEFCHTPGYEELDLSKMMTWGCGGDGMNANQENKTNNKLAEQGNTQKLSNGYGASEIGAPFATQKEGTTEPGSVGVPLPGNNVIIFDHDTHEILPINSVGDVCMVVDGAMVEYIGRKYETEEARISFPNGKVGINLKDAGFVDKDGNLFIKGRYGDEITTSDGKTVWPVDLENVIMQNNKIRSCAAISNGNDYDFSVFVVLEDNSNYSNNDVETEIRQLLENNNYSDFTFNVFVLDKMLLNPNGKIDRKGLKANYLPNTQKHHL